MARKRADTVKLVLRLPPPLHRALTRLAARHRLSLNNEMVLGLWRGLEADAETAQDWRDMKAIQEYMGRRYPKDPVWYAKAIESLDKSIAEAEQKESRDIQTSKPKDEPK